MPSGDAGNLTVSLGLDSNNFSRNISQVNNRISGLSNVVGGIATGNFPRMSSGLSTLTSNLGSFSSVMSGGLGLLGAIGLFEALTGAVKMLGGAIKDIIKDGIQYNKNLENSTTALKTLLGSEEKAIQLMKEIKDFAVATPFGTGELIKSTVMMKQFGIETEKLMPNLKMLGDLAFGDKEKLKGLSLAFSQISSTGKLMGQDLMQLVNAAFNPLQVISEETGISMSELKDTMSKGGISAEMVVLAMKRATSEGGSAFKGMEEASKTFDGRMSTLGDTMESLKGALVKPFFDFLASNVLPKIQNLLDVVMERLPYWMELAGKFYNAYIQPLFDRMSKWLVILRPRIEKAFGYFVEKIKRIAPTILRMIEVTITSIENAIDMFGVFAGVVIDLYNIFYETFDLIGSIVVGDTKQMVVKGEKLWNSFKEYFERLWQYLGRFVLGVTDRIVDAFKRVGIDINNVWSGVATGFVYVFNYILDEYDKIVGKLQKIGNIKGLKYLGGLGLGLQQFSKLQQSNFRLNPMADWTNSMQDAVKTMFNLTDAVKENDEVKKEDIKLTKDLVDWNKLFRDLLKPPTGKTLKDTLKELASAMDSTAKSFSNFTDIFGKVSRARVSANNLFFSMKAQLRQMKDWKKNIFELGQKLGTGNILYQELLAKGPASAGEISAVNRMSNEDLMSYYGMYREKAAIGTQLAGIQQAGKMGIGNAIQLIITGNNITDEMDIDIIANRIIKKLAIAGIK